MDAVTIIVIVAVVILAIVAGVVIYLSRRPKRMEYHAPPPEDAQPEEERKSPVADQPAKSAPAAPRPSQPAPSPAPPASAPPPLLGRKRSAPPPPAPRARRPEESTRSAGGLFDEPQAPPPPAPSGQPVPAKPKEAEKAVAPPPPAESAGEEEVITLDAVIAAEPPAAISTEDVRFTAFFPKEATVETWYSLLVYAHIEAALARVQADAARFKDEMGGAPKEAHGAAPAKLARGTEITIIPSCAGVTFNPERVSFKWVEDMHRADFRMQASKALAGLADNVLVTIYVGPLIVATIKGGIAFNEASSAPLLVGSTTQTTTTLYRSEQIFPSYSHTDEDIVIACRDAYEAIGWKFLRDRDTLRPGEDWNARLMQLIEQADIFQLFWSDNSARSAYCKQEWEHALGLQDKKLKGGDFIRPVYWKLPWVQPPAELSRFHFTYKPLAKP